MWNDFSSFGESKPGGFLSTTATSPTTSSQEKKQPARLSNVVPTTIARILQIPENEEHLKIGDLTASIVSFVGLVKSVDVQSTKLTYVVYDMSGPSIEVQIWLGENEEAQLKINSVRENTYARIIGAVRSMKGRRHIIAFNVAPITEVNEITMHMLEVLHTSMAIMSPDKESDSKAGFAMPNSSTFGGGVPQNPSFGFANKGLSKSQQIVLQSITNSTNSDGISVFDLYTSIKALNRAQIKEAIEFLSNEGHIYSTIDDDHFKSTESA